MQRKFQLVDVFSTDSLSGNPLAVVTESAGLSDDDMQKITRWMNFSESAFLLPATTDEADYKVRIFTLERELPFAGHPTLGSCHAWLQNGGKSRSPNKIVQECGAGLVALDRQESHLSFVAPPLLRSGPVDKKKLAEVATALRIPLDSVVDAQWVDNGPGWVAVLLESAEAVLAVDPVASYDSRIEIGIVGAYPEGSECAFELRAIFTDQNLAMREDPVTGSLNASVAQWMINSGRATPPYVASQGTRLGRAGRIQISSGGNGSVLVGGKTNTVVDGTFFY